MDDPVSDTPRTPLPTHETAPGNTPGSGFFVELLKFAIIAALIVVPIRFYVAQPFIVAGASMQPSFENGEYLIVDQISYRLEEPERGDVIIFRFPPEPSKFLIKRIVGLPNETIEIRNGTVFVRKDGEVTQLPEPYVAAENASAGFFTKKLNDDEYFVLGDNRSASSDSRTWGALPRDHIVGRALVRLLPINELSFMPGVTLEESTNTNL